MLLRHQERSCCIAASFLCWIQTGPPQCNKRQRTNISRNSYDGILKREKLRGSLFAAVSLSRSSNNVTKLYTTILDLKSRVY